MPTLNYGWRDGDGGDPPRVRVRLTPPAVRPSVLDPGKTVSTNTVMQESITGAGSFADFEPGLYDAIVTFGRPGSTYFTGAGDPIEALINMPNADADLGPLLEAAGVQPVASEWLSVVSNLLPRAEAEATYVRSVNGTPVDPVTGDVEVDGALPAGGSTGQVLTKLPDGPGWTTPATGGGSGGVLDGGTPTTTDDTFDGGTP